MTRDGYQDEIDYWARELALEGVHREHTEKRLNPAGRRDEHPIWIDGLIDVLTERKRGSGPPRALDLGCGPLGTLGHAHEVGRLDVTGVDPLADAYTELRTRFAIDYPEPLIATTGERLSEHIEPTSVDLVYSRNSLDHAEDVQRCFEEAARALRPGGVFALEVFAYEGFREGYDGLHRFDFHVHDGALGCTDEHGRQALNLADFDLELVTLEPRETRKPAGVGADTTTVRAVFARSRDPELLDAVRAATWLADERARVEQFLDPTGVYAHRIADGWDTELLRSMYPIWSDHVLGRVQRADPGLPRVLELDARSMPTLTWAQLSGHAQVEAADPQAAAFAEIFARHHLPPHPIRMREATAREVLADARPESFEVVHLRDALERDHDPEGLVELAARVLAPTGVLLLEGSVRSTSSEAWRHPFGNAVRLEDGHLVVRRHALGDERTQVLDPQGLGLESVVLTMLDASDPLREPGTVYRAAWRRPER